MSEAFTSEERHQLIAASKLMGALLRQPPSTASLQPFFELLKQGELPNIWPAGETASIKNAQNKLLSHPRDKELDLLWQNVMMGPQHLQAPPWGSVYLDHEQVIFGDSCVELSLFLKKIGIKLTTGVNEPEDHIGLMLWYIAGLLEQENDEILIILLQKHLFPWSSRYCQLAQEAAPHPFFEGLIYLLDSLLLELRNRLDVTPEEKRIYF